MAEGARAPSAVLSFAVVRRGYDPEQVTKHLNRIDAETTILAADRAAAMEQARQLGKRLDATRRELEAAHAEIERLRGELRIMAGPADSVATMNERLHTILRLTRDEFSAMCANSAADVAAHMAEIVAAVSAEARQLPDGGAPSSEALWQRPQNQQDIERMRREAAEERARLDDAAAARRAAVEKEFRETLALRCREAMAQIGRLQAESLHTAQQLINEADEQAKSMLTATRDAVRRTVEEAQREVDELHALRARLAAQLESSRKILDSALPGPRPPRSAPGHPEAQEAVRQRAGTDDVASTSTAAPTPAGSAEAAHIAAGPSPAGKHRNGNAIAPFVTVPRQSKMPESDDDQRGDPPLPPTPRR